VQVEKIGKKVKVASKKKFSAYPKKLVKKATES
jgi:hypothetical protein